MGLRYDNIPKRNKKGWENIVGELKTYKDFADNDTEYLVAAIEAGIRGNRMGAEAQEACEKYLKHIIDKYFTAETPEENEDKSRWLKSHNLHTLVNKVEQCGICIPDDLKSDIFKVDGYYFSTRCPGDNAYTMQEHDIHTCFKAVSNTKAFVEDLEREING